MVPPTWTVPARRSVRVGPRHWFGEGVVDLACPGPVAEPLERAPCLRVDVVAGESSELPRGDVGDEHPSRWELGQRLDPVARHHGAAESLEVAHQRVGDGLGPAPGERPAVDVGEAAQHQAERGGERAVEREEAVGGDAGEETACLVGLEPAGHRGGRPDGLEAEAGHGDRVPGRPHDGSHQLVREVIPVPLERSVEVGPGLAVGACVAHRGVERPVEHAGPAAVERVGEGDVGVDELAAVLLEGHAAEER